MTKVIVLGEETPKEEMKKIKFLKSINVNDGKHADAVYDPASWQYIELIKRSISGMDIMFAYDKPDRSNGVLYLGHFNDGIV